jgi:biopolymer transport protein ExbB/TolQ
MGTFLPLLHFAEISTLVVLGLLSVWSVGVMIDRRRTFRAIASLDDLAEAERLVSAGDRKKLTEWAQAGESILRRTLRTVLAVPAQKPETIEAAARGFFQKERQTLERGLTLLATLGSNAPFIGLFGTVLGIIEAFSALSADQTGSATVMASIAEALLATAAGLFVAIPAVVAYNVFSARVRKIASTCDSLKNLYLSRFAG